MNNLHDRKLFGFWAGMPYDDVGVTDRYEDFLGFENTIDRDVEIAHFESLHPWLCSVQSTDIFTGEQFNSGFYEDGEFMFPVDFLRYYKSKSIGIPYEYEQYLTENLQDPVMRTICKLQQTMDRHGGEIVESKKTPAGIVAKLRAGEQVLCPNCGKGVLVPYGNYKTTPRFTCSFCKIKMNID